MLKFLVPILILGVALGVPTLKKHVPLLDGRIVGGEDADIADYPYQVALLYSTFQICGGSIISSRWVVSAGHCADTFDPAVLSVRVGSSLSESGGAVYRVYQAIIHPSFNENLDYDISLLQVSSEIAFGDSVAAVALPALNSSITAGSIATITGWGDTDEDGTIPSVLQVVEVPVISQEDCVNAYADYVVSDRMFCAGLLAEGGKDACQGDSGGPVVIGGVLTGIVSWGIGCAEPDYPGVYTRVPVLVDWIKETTGL
ncbi:hypothetical protein NQ317_014436 [Molorchus minor]|uniref:Peptidase S1 domain-containing protein n=1 Tax=Molorchus minor TaxID=1323400 RepID=A0ABQ9K6W8_9CUCU|nr:hypothetical protein NQ317_014436 [Molorchus minor]